MSGCPSSVSPREVACLQRWARYKRVIEAGALLGYSAIKMAEVANHVISIDQHRDYRGDTLRRYLSNLERAGIRHRVTPVVGPAVPLIGAFPDQEFAFIDLTGSFYDTYNCLMRVDAPTIGVHDFGRSNCWGVEEAIKRAGVEVLEHIDTLVIVRKRGTK